MYPFARFPFARFLEDIVQVELPMIRIHTCEFTHTNLCVINQPIRIRTYDLVILLFITFWKNVLLTSTWILGPAYTFVHRWLIMANLILPNKYMNQEDANHLMHAIGKYYPMTVDKEATKYIGLTIEWEYKKMHTSICQATYQKLSLDSNTRCQ
jgi:hypothetical protein